MKEPSGPRLGSSSDLVAQDPDVFDLQLDDVTRAKEPIEIEAATPARRARAVYVSRMDVLTIRNMHDHVGPRPVGLVRPGATPLLVVDTADHFEVGFRPDFVGGDDARFQRRGEVLTLCRAEPRRHLARLNVARRKVVHDGEAEDVLPRILALDVASTDSHDHRKLEFEVDLRAVARPATLLVGSDDRAVVSLVVDGSLVPVVGHLRSPAFGARLDVILERKEVAQ